MQTIPYREELVNLSACFLLPDNTLIFGNCIHEESAKSILVGTTIFPKYNLNLQRLESNVSLSEEELHLFNAYLNFVMASGLYTDLHSNFLVQMLNYDRIRLHFNNSILTCNSRCYTKYYNYYLMDHDIIHLPKIILENGNFVYKAELDDEEYKVYEDLKSKKRLVRTNQRYKYFKENDIK